MSKAEKASKGEPKPASAPEPQPQTAIPAFGSGEELKALQEMSANLARAAMIAQGAIAEAVLKQAEQPSSAPVDPFRVAPALTGMMGRLAAQPDKVLKAQAELFSGYMNLWQSTARKLAGESVE